VPSLVYANSWKELAPGLHHKILTINYDNTSAQLSALKVNLKQIDLRPIYDTKRKTVREIANESKAIAVINANFFDEEGKVLGLVKIANQTKHPKKKISWWSVLCINKSRASIVHSSKHYDGQCYHALQAGPRLVVNGSIPKLKEESSQKSAIGLISSNEAVIVTSRRPLPIKILAETFKKPESDGGLGCRDALNFDGGSSSQFYVNAGEFMLNIPNFTKVPAALGVFSK